MSFWKAFLKGFCIFYLQICAIVLTSIANSSYNNSPHFYIVPKGEMNHCVCFARGEMEALRAASSMTEKHSS